MKYVSKKKNRNKLNFFYTNKLISSTANYIIFHPETDKQVI